MNETTLIDTLAAAIYDNAALAAWCVTNYGQRHRVYKGIDEENLPDPQTDYPAVNVEFDEKTEGYGIEERVHEVFIAGGLYDADVKSQAREFLYEYEFTANLATFARSVKDIVKTALPTLEIAKLILLYDRTTYFPMVKFEMYITFNEQYCQGDDPFD